MTRGEQQQIRSDCANTAPTPAEAQPLALARTRADEYCRAVRRCRHNEFWWYYNALTRRCGSSKPFQDGAGRWWWCVKSWFAWPVDFFSNFEHPDVHPRRALLGWQFPVLESQANSHVCHNVITDLGDYDLHRIQRKSRRHMVRRALRELQYSVVDPAERSIAEEACAVWNSHVERTGWNRTMSAANFARSWAELRTMPGTTVIVARETGSAGALCAWLVTRIIDHTMFIDTIASHTDRLAKGPNDGLIFLALWSAAKLGVDHAHYGLLSNIESLEAFKRSMGFTPHPFPCRLHLRAPVEALLRRCRPAIYQRLLGADVPLAPQKYSASTTVQQSD